MTEKITTDPKVPAASAAEHGCCGGEAAVESRTGTAKATHQDHGEHAVPSKARESSCCCGNKDGQPTT